MPLDRVQGILELLLWFKKKKQVSARIFLSLLGKLNAEAQFVVLGRQHLRALQMALFGQWKPHVLPLEYPILLNAPIRKHLEWWENKGSFILGVTLKQSLPTQSFYGCEPLWMGSPSRTGRTVVSWSLDSRSISFSYQCFRDESNIASSKTMSPVCLQFNSDDCHGQLFSSFVPEERKGLPFSISEHGGMGDAPVVQSERYISSGETYPRNIEHFSRPVKLSFQTNFDRTISGSDDFQLDSVGDGLSKHRPVCDSSQQEVATLCVSYPRWKGSCNRCNVNELELNAHLRVSSVCSDSSDNQQDSPILLQNSVDSSSLGRNVLVSRHCSVSSSTGQSDSLARKSGDTIGSEFCQENVKKLKTSLLEFICRSIRDWKFSANIVRHAAEARRSSTRRVYDVKWKVFSNWCMQREAHLFSATPLEVADICYICSRRRNVKLIL